MVLCLVQCATKLTSTHSIPRRTCNVRTRLEPCLMVRAICVDVAWGTDVRALPRCTSRADVTVDRNDDMKDVREAGRVYIGVTLWVNSLMRTRPREALTSHHGSRRMCFACRARRTETTQRVLEGDPRPGPGRRKHAAR